MDIRSMEELLKIKDKTIRILALEIESCPYLKHGVFVDYAKNDCLRKHSIYNDVCPVHPVGCWIEWASGGALNA